MAEESKDSNGSSGATPASGAGAPQTDQRTEPQLQLMGQYVKDLSFENPGVGRAVQRPQIEFNVDLQANRVGEATHYEVLMKLRVSASDESKPMFLLELAYAGLFALSNVPEDSLQPILLIECPRIIFPFARRIVADVVRDGGLPPLMIEPIDFATLYRNKVAEASNQRVS